jgi:hypothetical protein
VTQHPIKGAPGVRSRTRWAGGRVLAEEGVKLVLVGPGVLDRGDLAVLHGHPWSSPPPLTSEVHLVYFRRQRWRDLPKVGGHDAGGWWSGLGGPRRWGWRRWVGMTPCRRPDKTEDLEMPLTRPAFRLRLPSLSDMLEVRTVIVWSRDHHL